MRAYHPGSRGEQYAFEQRCAKYGITPKDYGAQRDRQANACGICATPALNGRELHIDHDHVTGDVRGLLCSACNKALGLMRDNAARLRAAAEYLELNGTQPKDEHGRMAAVPVPVAYKRRCKRCKFGKVTAKVTAGLCRRCMATATVQWRHDPDDPRISDAGRRRPPGDVETDDIEHFRWLQSERARERLRLGLGPKGCVCGHCQDDVAYCAQRAERSGER